MTKTSSQTYDFVFRGLLCEEALDRAGRAPRDISGDLEEAVVEKLSIRLLDDELVASSSRMATVYTAIAAFENSVRDLVSKRLLEARGEGWWDTCVSSAIKKRAKSRQEEEEKHRFHKQRGDAPITYTTLPNLANIIRANYEDFEAFFPSPEWVTSTFDPIDRSRNVIMHSGTLDREDIERVGTHLRDWIKQVGA